MRIQELEQRTGLDRATIRYYEREGLINPKRNENGYREYVPEDVQQLLKIKLLRKLEMPIEQIRQLQQGSGDFEKAIETQMILLGNRIGEQKRAGVICQIISTDGAKFESLDAAHYLRLMENLPAENAKTKVFQEEIPQEIHPWRRFFARTIDLSLFAALMQFVIFVVIRLRPVPDDFLMTLIQIGCGFLYLPVETLMLHKWGTTPGKWAMGIRLEWIQGGHLPYLEAIYRAWRVLKYGMGFGIPLVELGFQMYCFRKLTGRPISRWQKYNEIDPPTEMDWDDDTEILYSPWEGKGRYRAAVLVAAYLMLISVVACDSVKPVHRSNDLTVEQFAENYNCTVSFLSPDLLEYDQLNPDGTHTDSPSGSFNLLQGTNADGERSDFHYKTDCSHLRSVTYECNWYDICYLHPLYGDCRNAAVTALLSQPGNDFPELYEFLKLLEANHDQSTGRITYGSIEVQWNMDCKNLTCNAGILFPIDPERPSELHFQYQLIIHEA